MHLTVLTALGSNGAQRGEGRVGFWFDVTERAMRNPSPHGGEDRAALARQLTGLAFADNAIALRAAAIHAAVLRDSSHVRAANFDRIGEDDLQRLFCLYDEHVFAGALRAEVDRQAAGRLTFRLSRRLTRCGGTTTQHRRRRMMAGAAVVDVRYEIAISSTLLFQTFADLDRTVRVSGVECHDRLQALQRIFEHELLHLAEWLAWGRSRCSAPRFLGLARQIFGHTESKHDLVTQRERAAARYHVHVGNRVAFQHEGQTQIGLVNRITRRATVLVECPSGVPYTDGKRYARFYVPLHLLRRAGD
jgi:hypothetical protein